MAVVALARDAKLPAPSNPWIVTLGAGFAGLGRLGLPFLLNEVSP